MNLPVSYGEAIDKLTILDIKLDKIKDDRKIDVKKEYDAIYSFIEPLLNPFSKSIRQDSLSLIKGHQPKQTLIGFDSIIKMFFNSFFIMEDFYSSG